MTSKHAAYVYVFFDSVLEVLYNNVVVGFAIFFCVTTELHCRIGVLGRVKFCWSLLLL